MTLEEIDFLIDRALLSTITYQKEEIEHLQKYNSKLMTVVEVVKELVKVLEYYDSQQEDRNQIDYPFVELVEVSRALRELEK